MPRVLYALEITKTAGGAILRLTPPSYTKGQFQVERMAEGQEVLTRKQCFRISDALFEQRPVSISCKTMQQANALMAQINSKHEAAT